ncbi:MAG: hypothetical protein KGL45_16385 [Gammaproteobacteria bacterium]|nr:hypothetical protein [Gammaproteobacteria bacterium]
MIIAPRAARPQPRRAPNDLLTVHQRAWLMLRLSWQRRQAELAAAAATDAAREEEIESNRRRLVYARIRAGSWRPMP